MIVVVAGIIIFCRIQIITNNWTDGTMLIIVAVVIILEKEISVTDRQTDMYDIHRRIVRLTRQV